MNVKECRRCLVSKKLEVFSKNQTWCKACRAEYYQQEKQRALERNRINKEKLRQWIRTQKLSVGCSFCGYNKCAAALDYHHPNPDKEGGVGNAVRNGWSRSRIENEISKCMVLCANCHRELHA